MLIKLLRFYRRHLSRYLFFRFLRVATMGGYRLTYHLGCRLLPGGTVRRYALQPWSEYQGGGLLQRYSLFAARTVQLPGPVFLNEPPLVDDPGPLSIPEPEIQILEFQGASVVGGTDFVLTDRVALAPDRFMEFGDTCPAAEPGIASVDHLRKSLTLFLSRQQIRLPAAISLVGQNTGNYAHWLTETLPKLALLGADPRFRDLPLLVDRGLHPNISDSLRIVGGADRPQVELARWQEAIVDRLVGVSQTGYEPYIPHGLFNTGIPRVINGFSAPGLAALRTAVLAGIGSGPEEGGKVYLGRSGGSNNLRGLANAAEIEALLRVRGFRVVDPVALPFAEQVRLCRTARLIVAPIGAGLANMIFAPPSCKVVALSPCYENANYYFYANLAGTLGLPFSYVLGRQTDDRGHPAHRSYYIPPEVLSRGLDRLGGD